MSSLYRENILDHYRNPRNEGELTDADIVHEENNPLCGDRQVWHLKTKKLKDQKTLKDVKFQADGCAISIAAASMLSEKIKSMSPENILKLDKDDMEKLIGTKISPGRLKCLLLPLDTVKNALNEKEQ